MQHESTSGCWSPVIGTRTTSSAFNHALEGPQGNMVSQEATPGHNPEMCELVEYGLEDHKATATTRVHIMRRDDKASATQDEGQAETDCQERDHTGKHVLPQDPCRPPGYRSGESPHVAGRPLRRHWEEHGALLDQESRSRPCAIALKVEWRGNRCAR